jgi:hypothetical protein
MTLGNGEKPVSFPAWETAFLQMNRCLLLPFDYTNEMAVAVSKKACMLREHSI